MFLTKTQPTLPLINKCHILSGSTWNARRKIMNLAFRFNIIENAVPIMSEQSQILISVLKENYGDKGRDIDIHPAIENAILDIIYGNLQLKRIPNNPI
jgi:cytochrome P450